MDHIVEGRQHGLDLRYLKHDVVGFVVYMDERLRGELYQQMLTVVREDLQEIVRILPPAVVHRLISAPIRFWVNLNCGKSGCCCHWMDLPDEYMSCKSHSVEIFDVEDFLQQTEVQPAHLLHEVSHWLHCDIINQEQRQLGTHDPWTPSTGQISRRLGDGAVDSDTLLYHVSKFRNECLNGKFSLDKRKLGRFDGNLDYSHLSLVQQHDHDNTKPSSSRSVICRCTDRFSKKNLTCPDRWHLESDGIVLAYRLGTDFGMSVAGWYEWVNDKWLPSEGAAEAVPDEREVFLAEGFSQDMLNGPYIAKNSVDDLYLSKKRRGTTGHRVWVRRAGGPEVLLRCTNRFSHWSDAQMPFDRWHLEIEGFGCSAYVCDLDPASGGQWEEAVLHSTDQKIFGAYLSSLPLYAKSSERVGQESCEAHYAATNHKEYFAECSEAYFSSQRFRNDYFPYIHEELKAYDPVGYALCESIWGPRNGDDELEIRYLEAFWPRKNAGSASQLVATPDGKREFLALVHRSAHDRREEVLKGNQVIMA
eukprot:Skav225623  [mRNA]  locus=scaffold4894:228594:230189:- [translate_table: standard]